MKNILLDRFTIDSVNEFQRSLKDGYSINLVVFRSKVELKEKNFEYYSSLPLSKGIGVESCPWTLSRESLRYFSKYESVFLSVLSRSDIYKNSFTTEEMSDHYYRLVNFWVYKLKSNQIEIIFSLDVPHVASSFALYIAAKYLKISTIYLDMAFAYNKYLFFGCSFTNRMLLTEGGELNSSNLVDAYENYIESYNINSTKTFSKYDKHLYLRIESKWWFTFVMDMASMFPFSIRELVRKRKFKFRGLYTSELPWKVSRRQWSDNKSGFLRINYAFAKYKEYITIYLSRLRYRKLCVNDIDGVGDYVLFAPSAEPEGATLPVAMECRRIYNAIKSVASALPEGVSIVYKEHHVTFNHQLPFVSKWKSKYYYDDIQKIGNIFFSRDDISTKKLIKQSVGVACVNGSIAFESVVNNKRCITFSPQWYDELDGIHKCESQEDVEEALSLMCGNVAPNPNSKDQTHLNNFIELEGIDATSYTKQDYEKICKGMWQSYKSFENADERKWEI